ncbi:MAG TPA: glycosyltransferase, partial [Verrucomicrobiae bacterium]|nr:glycosyltransferase [Verrucomicrobiae bacterium]
MESPPVNEFPLWTRLLGLAAAGGVLWWREGRRQQRRRPLPEKISIVMPTLNEVDILEETLRRARAVPEIHEIIVVDGGSADGTRDLAARLGCRVLVSAPGRG